MISGTSIVDNVADSDEDDIGFGGGMFVEGGDVDLNGGVTIEENRAFDGAGIHVAAGTLTANESTVADNDAAHWGGGIANSAGTLTITRSTIADNTAELAGGIWTAGATTVTNGTVSGNTGTYGAGGVATSSGTFSLVASTVSFNTAGDNPGAGGVLRLTAGTLDLRGSVVAENSAGNFPDCFLIGGATSHGYNVVGDDSGCGYTPGTGDQVGTRTVPIDPLLGPLQDNGGAVETHALLQGSPAIDAIPATACAVTVDARGVARPKGAGCDIGAYEAPSAIPPGSAALDTVGLVDPATGQWHLRNMAGAVTSFFYGNPGDVPFVGDWDGDGVATPGLFRTSDAFAYLRNSNSQGVADIRFFFGNPSDVPLSGDWDGDGKDTLSIYRPSEQRFYIINELGENEGGLGAADFSFLFGNPGDKPVAGDWDADGIDEVGLHRESTGFFYWRNTLDTGVADGEIFFGDPDDRFVAGDWGVIDGTDTPGLFRPSDVTFYFRHTLTQGVADSQFTWTGAGSSWLPVAGTFGLG
jgi:lactocepin